MSNKKRHPESILQSQCVTWFKIQYPKEVIFAIPNGGKRNVVEAAKMKGEGVLAGVADLFIMSSKNGYNGLFVEMKFGRNNISPLQKEFIQLARDKGYKVEVCYTFDEFTKTINNYFN